MTTAPQRPRVLVVEDEPIVAADLQTSLQELGYGMVGTASTGAEALDIAGRSSPDIVLMEIALKGAMDGIAAAGEMRRRWNIPVVFITGNVDESILLRASEAGPYGYLLKPFRTKELKAAIVVALQQHRLAIELFSEHTWVRTMLQSLRDGVIATDAQGRVRYLNPVGSDLVGYTIEEALGNPIEDVYRLTTTLNEPVEMCQLRRALLTNVPVAKSRFLLHRRDGRTIPIEDAASPIQSAGEVTGAVTVFADITDRLRREHALETERERLEEQVQLATDALGSTRAELRALSAHLMTAQEEERRRVARELHDDISQHAALAEFDLARVIPLLSPQNEEARQGIEAVRQRIAHLSTAVRDVSHRLHPAVVEDLGLRAALRALVDEYRNGGGEASFAAGDLDPASLTLAVSTALYRIAQEALRNVHKHAEGAPVRVALERSAGELRLRVEDTGPGFDLNQVRGGSGLGLISMQERARLAGGTLLVRTCPGDGTVVLVRIPVDDPHWTPADRDFAKA